MTCCGNVVPAEEVKDSIYTRDQSVNELERSIRRKILRHLTIHPGDDVAACLALMSVAKDAERIGDYCKKRL
jgi:phosphate transport system protein